MQVKRILFVIRSTQLYFYFEPIITSLLAQGHKLKLLFDEICSKDSLDSLHLPGSLDISWAPRDKSRWRKPVYYARDLLSFRRYLQMQGQSDFYRQRWLRNSLKPFKPFIFLPIVQKLLTSLPVISLIRVIEQLLPIEKEIKKIIGDFGPDVVVCAPANFGFSSAEIEYLNAAKKMKIATVVPVMSWDNLTTKGVFVTKPDLLLVWNKMQSVEAKEQGFAASEVRVIGAPMFDWLFDKKQDFSKNHKWPIILYLGSSSDIAGDERFLITKLQEALLASSDKRLRHAQIVVRPHPLNNSYYRKFRLRNVKVTSNNGFPLTKKDRKDYIDELENSDVVVGINTSGMIDAIIADKPVISIILPQYERTQTQTLHFKYLMDSDVLLPVFRVEDFPKQLAKILDGVDSCKEQRRLFLKRMVRPRGIAKSAGASAVLAILEVC